MTTYTGGKKTIGREIAQVVMQWDPAGPGQSPYWEPFVGMCGVMQHIQAPVRLGSDLHSEVIAMWQALQEGWEPPKQFSQAQYEALKRNPQGDPALRAFVGHGYSYCGSYFGAYKPKYSTYDQGAGRRAWEGVMRTLDHVRDVQFFVASYDEVPWPTFGLPAPWLIYCDPPYARTAARVGKNASGVFDHAAFWDWVRDMSRQHTVIVSEVTAPPDFVRVWSKQRHLKIALRGSEQQHIDEGLFVHASVVQRFAK